MITEDYVSFETAKLLKEKGFDGEVLNYFNADTMLSTTRTARNWNRVKVFHSAPTLQMAMKWLREEHNLFIGVNTVIGNNKNWGYEVFIQRQEIPIPSKMQWDWFNSYEEACEAAIKYCLENLI